MCHINNPDNIKTQYSDTKPTKTVCGLFLPFNIATTCKIPVYSEDLNNTFHCMLIIEQRKYRLVSTFVY